MFEWGYVAMREKLGTGIPDTAPYKEWLGNRGHHGAGSSDLRSSIRRRCSDLSLGPQPVSARPGFRCDFL